MSCALPDMVVTVAFGRNAADDEDAMCEMMCCNTKTGKFEGLKTSISRLGGIVVVDNLEEVRSVGDQL